MKKLVGLGILILGILIVAGTFTFTPAHAYNPVDSTNGVETSAVLLYSGLIVFGAGLVVYMSTQLYAGEKNRL